MSPIHHESVFGDAIVAAPLRNGWELGSNADCRPERTLDTAQLFTFIAATQTAEWEEDVSMVGKRGVDIG